MPTHYTYQAAFPFQYTDKSGTTHVYTGLNVREYYAAMAMQGICGDGIAGHHHIPENTARDAVAHADALIAELAKPVKP